MGIKDAYVVTHDRIAATNHLADDIVGRIAIGINDLNGDIRDILVGSAVQNADTVVLLIDHFPPFGQ